MNPSPKEVVNIFLAGDLKLFLTMIPILFAVATIFWTFVFWGEWALKLGVLLWSYGEMVPAMCIGSAGGWTIRRLVIWRKQR